MRQEGASDSNWLQNTFSGGGEWSSVNVFRDPRLMQVPDVPQPYPSIHGFIETIKDPKVLINLLNQTNGKNGYNDYNTAGQILKFISQ